MYIKISANAPAVLNNGRSVGRNGWPVVANGGSVAGNSRSVINNNSSVTNNHCRVLHNRRVVENNNSTVTGNAMTVANNSGIVGDNKQYIKSPIKIKTMADFIPRSDGDMLSWLANFQTKIITHGPTLGLSPAEVTATTTACTTLYGLIQAVLAAKTDLANAVAAKEESKDGDLKLIREKIARIKTHEAYTIAIGEDLGIVSNATDPDLENKKPELTIRSYAGYIRIKFTKKGFTAIKIFTRLKGQPGWIFLAIDTSSPYDDHRALAVANQPEEREYMAIGMVGDEEVGLQSDIVSVVFGG